MKTPQKSAVWTDHGMLRIRWWPFAVAGTVAGFYNLYNILIFLLVVAGFARGFKADSVLTRRSFGSLVVENQPP